MDSATKDKIILLYQEGHSIREIESIIKQAYRREAIRCLLKNSGINLRGISFVYPPYQKFDTNKSVLFAELLGYFYGDGYLCKNKRTHVEEHIGTLSFALNEAELVNRVFFIFKSLFGFEPYVYKLKHNYSIRFRRTFSRYLKNLGYPVGKKSVINPRLPLGLLKNKNMKIGFIRGFLNAEAGVHKTLTVQQSVRVELSSDTIKKLIGNKNPYNLYGTLCYFIKWSEAKKLIPSEKIVYSNILLDLKSLLNDFDIPSRVYPVRLYVGKKIGIHFELSLPKGYLHKIKGFNMLSCSKKLAKLNVLLQG